MSKIPKFIDRDRVETWTHPLDPGFKVECVPVAEPFYTTNLEEVAHIYIKHGVKKILQDGDEVDKSPHDLSSDIQTALLGFIYGISKLDRDEEQDSQLPPGSASTELTTTATDAGGVDGDA
jgi:hypothetical protein